MVRDDALVIVLAGGAGERLSPLTRDRAKPAVYFGGPYRIIDFVLSNCVNSGLRRVFIATQYKSLSLNRHIRMGWNIVSEELGEFIEILPPQKRVGEHWYLGTADAVYQNLYSIEREAPRHVVVLAGDHVYKMDYRKMLARPRRSSAPTSPWRRSRCRSTRRRASGWWRSTATAASSASRRSRRSRSRCPACRTWRWRRWASTSSTWTCWCRRSTPTPPTPTAITTSARTSCRCSSARAGSSPIPFYDENKKTAKYWRDIGTLDAYYEANMDLCHVNPEFNLYDPEWPLRTHQPQAPPAKFVFADERRMGTAMDSVISPGCIVSGSQIRGSILCPNVRVHSFAVIENSILMPGVQVGRHARIRNAIIDRDVLVPRGAIIGHDLAEDRQRHTVTDRGIVVVTVDEDARVGPIGADVLAIEAGVDRA